VEAAGVYEICCRSVLEIGLDAIRGSNGNSILRMGERGSGAASIGGLETRSAAMKVLQLGLRLGNHETRSSAKLQ
jgi:hypothetical protein